MQILRSLDAKHDGMLMGKPAMVSELLHLRQGGATGIPGLFSHGSYDMGRFQPSWPLLCAQDSAQPGWPGSGDCDALLCAGAGGLPILALVVHGDARLP